MEIDPNPSNVMQKKNSKIKNWLIVGGLALILIFLVTFIFPGVPFCHEIKVTSNTASLDGAFIDNSLYSENKENLYPVEVVGSYRHATGICAIPDGGMSKLVNFTISVFEDNAKTKQLAYFDKSTLGLRSLSSTYFEGQNSAITIFPYSPTEYEIIVAANSLDQLQPASDPVYIKVNRTDRSAVLISSSQSKYVNHEKAKFQRVMGEDCWKYQTCAGAESVLNIYGKKIPYDPGVWTLIEDRYCTPAKGENGKKYNGTPCDVIGFTFKYKKSDNPEDKIIEGGRQPMACDHTKERFCDDGLAIRTNSTNEEVTDFYTYLVMNLK